MNEYLDLVTNLLMISLTSWFCGQFLKNSILYRDQFEKGDDQKLSHNQLVRLVTKATRPEFSDE